MVNNSVYILALKHYVIIFRVKSFYMLLYSPLQKLLIITIADNLGHLWL